MVRLPVSVSTASVPLADLTIRLATMAAWVGKSPLGVPSDLALRVVCSTPPTVHLQRSVPGTFSTGISFLAV